MEIYLIRHTAVYNPQNLCYGQSEIPLEENFTADFDWIADNLQTVLKDDVQIMSSPYRRCTKLADYISNGNYQTNENLSELNFGDWELKPWTDIDSIDLNNWMSDFVNYKIRNGESFKTLFDRSLVTFNKIKTLDKRSVIICTHAGVIRSILANILEFPLKNAFSLAIDYSSITKITLKPNYEKVTLNYINKTK